MKTIYLEPEEEITAVVDILTQTEAKEIALVIPTGAQILQNVINLKLLKREANYLDKDITIITTDELGQELAVRADFAVKSKIDPAEVEDFPSEEETVNDFKEEDKGDIIDALVEGIESDKNKKIQPRKQLASSQPVKVRKIKPMSSKMVDIIIPKEDSPKEDSPMTSRPSIKSRWKKKPLEEESLEEELIEKEEPIEISVDQEKKDEGIDSLVEETTPKKKYTLEVESSKDDSDLLKEFDTLEGDTFEEEKELEKPEEARPARFSFGFLKRLFSSKLLFIFVAVAIIAAGSVAYMVLPTAEVVITPKTERITFDLEVEGSKDISQIDSVDNKIPIQLVTVEKNFSKEFPATGEKQLNEKARGTITVYNEYSSEPQILVANTRFLSLDGKLFRTTKQITIPGAKIEEGKIIASSLDVEARADQPGTEYNIGPTEFTIPGFKDTPKYAGFYGRSEESMTGGSTEKVKVVTAKDLETAEKILSGEVEGVITQALEEQMPSDLKLIEGALKEEIIEVSADAEEETEVDKFIMSITVQSQALLFNEKDLSDLVDLNLVLQIEEGKTLLSETQQISWDKPAINWSKATISLSLHIQEDVAWQIDEEKIKNDLVGLNEIAVRKYLGNSSNIRRAKVTFWPFWVKHMPIQANKIKVIIE